LIKIHNLGSRSSVLNKMLEALTNALKNIGDGSIASITINVKYFDGNMEREVSTSITP